ncbi:maltotransferase domain-containing protein [Dietzia sp. 179-F 9C3 NHS]|uniref:maltotransferase domain-containing protein n=1 Tax=Dietzia sp. 179-F 9C3 NHS TaxID=3374295 RepID=UPI003879C61D
MNDRLGIDDVRPLVSCGRFPSKSVVGEIVPISATVWREGHDALSASLVVRRPGGASSRTTMVPGAEADTVHALLPTDTPGMWSFRVEAWSDPFATWKDGIGKKMDAGQGADVLGNEFEVGARVLDAGAAQASAGGDTAGAELLSRAAAALRGGGDAHARTAVALSPEVTAAMAARPVRDLVTVGQTHRVWVDRREAQFSSWYEFFPRSTGGWDEQGRPVHGTFATSRTLVDHAADMGFDVVYLPPIHPIGEINRKGRNNTLTPEPHDVGSPWAIGSADGGHDAVHPALGTIEDFRDLVEYSADRGVEIALDLALQCAPDHPWAQDHPEWFTVLPDGHIAYAENPPKKYQDIYPLNFDLDPEGLYTEVLRVVRLWTGLGVRIFRVDNPHTKPGDFWHRLIGEVKRTEPDVLFLSEAFTRPARLFGLAKRGFSQSYTYFTWKTTKAELVEFCEQFLAHVDECRPNMFTNTPDILHESLQRGGPAMFAIRAALAATLSPAWGVYSGFELYEWEPVAEGSEEYLDSEKYELRPRDFAGAEAAGQSLAPWLRDLNRIRRAHPALQQLRTLRFHEVDNDRIIAYSKIDPATGDCVLAVITLDSHGAQEGTLTLDMAALGYDDDAQFSVHDEVSGREFHWGRRNYVRLEPWSAVAHIVAVPPCDEARRVELTYRTHIVE